MCCLCLFQGLVAGLLRPRPFPIEHSSKQQKVLWAAQYDYTMYLWSYEFIGYTENGPFSIKCSNTIFLFLKFTHSNWTDYERFAAIFLSTLCRCKKPFANVYTFFQWLLWSLLCYSSHYTLFVNRQRNQFSGTTEKNFYLPKQLYKLLKHLL